MKHTTQKLFEIHNKNLLNAIMQESETTKALKKTIKEIGICLN